MNLRAWFSMFAVGAILAVTSAQILVSLGRPFPLSPFSLIVTLALLGPVIFGFTLPVRRYQKRLQQYRQHKSARPGRVNPFFAFRVLILSRASALAGSAFTGWHAGLLIAIAILGLAGAPLTPNLIWGLLASAALFGFSVWAEHNCRITDDSPPADEATA